MRKIEAELGLPQRSIEQHVGGASYEKSTLDVLRQVTGALEALHALVRGECPSLLRDDHHDQMAADAIAAGNAALADLRPQVRRSLVEQVNAVLATGGLCLTADQRAVLLGRVRCENCNGMGEGPPLSSDPEDSRDPPECATCNGAGWLDPTLRPVAVTKSEGA
jgi:hypothetical protein